MDNHFDFARCIGGNNLEELDELLSIMTDRAFEETE